MNRRSFLFGLGMVACTTSVRPRSKGRTRRTHRPVDAHSERRPICVDLSPMVSQLSASPLAFRGDTLVQSFGGELRVWNSLSLKRTHTWTVPHRHFCFVQDGTLVAFGWPSAVGLTSVIHRVSRGKLRSAMGPEVVSNNTVVVMPARAPDEIYVITDYIYRFTATGVPAVFPHPYPNDATREQWISRGDRLMGGTIGAIYQVALGAPVTEFPIARRDLKHLVAATGDRVWYSYSSAPDEEWNAHTLVLAPETAPMVHERLIDVAPCRIVHLASYRNTVAALLMTMGSTWAELNWKVAVFDESGKERWRAHVADELTTPLTPNRGFVSIGEHRVVFSSADGALRAWDVDTGEEVTPRL